MNRASTTDARAEHVAARLHSAAIQLLRRLRREDDTLGLTAPRLSVLSVLVFAGPRTLGELAAAEQVRPPTMTRLVAALERQGLLRRMADPSDGRIVRVAATPKGRSLLLRGRGKRVSALARELSVLTANELHVLEAAVSLLDRIGGRSGQG